MYICKKFFFTVVSITLSAMNDRCCTDLIRNKIALVYSGKNNQKHSNSKLSTYAWFIET